MMKGNVNLAPFNKGLTDFSKNFGQFEKRQASDLRNLENRNDSLLGQKVPAPLRTSAGFFSLTKLEPESPALNQDQNGNKWATSSMKD